MVNYVLEPIDFVAELVLGFLDVCEFLGPPPFRVGAWVFHGDKS